MTTEIVQFFNEYPVYREEKVQEERHTEMRTTRVWLGVAAALCFTGAIVSSALAFTASPVFLFAAVPLLAGFGAIVWYNYVWIDFDNPKELAAVRLKAEANGLADRVAHVEGYGIEIELARLHLGEVEHVVDHGHQRLA